MRSLSEVELRVLDEFIHDDLGNSVSTFCLSDPVGTVRFAVRDSIAYVDLLVVANIGQGNGKKFFDLWEKSLSDDVVAIALMSIDSPSVLKFWRKVGFSELYHKSEDLDEAVPLILIKAANSKIPISKVNYGIAEVSSRYSLRR